MRLPPTLSVPWIEKAREMLTTIDARPTPPQNRTELERTLALALQEYEHVVLPAFAENADHNHRAAHLNNEAFLRQYDRADKLQNQLNELLFAVQRKFDGENRYETALRYIRETEKAAKVESMFASAVEANQKAPAP